MTDEAVNIFEELEEHIETNVEIDANSEESFPIFNRLDMVDIEEYLSQAININSLDFVSSASLSFIEIFQHLTKLDKILKFIHLQFIPLIIKKGKKNSSIKQISLSYIYKIRTMVDDAIKKIQYILEVRNSDLMNMFEQHDDLLNQIKAAGNVRLGIIYNCLDTYSHLIENIISKKIINIQLQDVYDKIEIDVLNSLNSIMMNSGYNYKLYENIMLDKIRIERAKVVGEMYSQSEEMKRQSTSKEMKLGFGRQNTNAAPMFQPRGSHNTSKSNTTLGGAGNTLSVKST